MIAVRRMGIVGMFLVSLTIGSGPLCRAEPAIGNKPDKLQQLLDARARIAEQAYLACTVCYDAGTIELDQVLTTSNEFARAELALCKSKNEKIAVHEAHVKREKSLEDRIRGLAAVNAKGGEADKVSRALLNRVNAEIDLEQEQRTATAGENP